LRDRAYSVNRLFAIAYRSTRLDSTPDWLNCVIKNTPQYLNPKWPLFLISRFENCDRLSDMEVLLLEVFTVLNTH
jgi:hypothetical protein